MKAIFLSLAFFLAHAFSQEDGCSIRTDDVPCLHVPWCERGTAEYSNFLITTEAEDVPAVQQTNGTICWDRSGLHLSELAEEKYIFTPYDQCNDPVFVSSDVLEVFISPVRNPQDNPDWYYELDTAPSGAAWGGISDNSKGNVTYCTTSTGCTSDGNLECTGVADFANGVQTSAFNQTNAWGIKMSIPWTIFADEFQPTTAGPWAYWRANFYRYDYPNGPDEPYELSGWSSTHNPSFHVPSRFGVLVLDGF